jgi:hypothetical protein
MIDAWWTPESSRFVGWLVWVGPLDGLLWWLAARGRQRAAFFVSWISIMILYAVIGIAGVLGLVLGQPDYIWVPLTTVGLVIAGLHWYLLRRMRGVYLQAELRKSVSQDL